MNKQKFYIGYGLLSAVLMVLFMFSFSPAMAENYELYIAGTQVTDANCNDLSKIKGVWVTEDGWFKYDPAKKMLLMKEVTVSLSNGKSAIVNDIEGLRIEVLGTNSLKTTNSATLVCRTSTEIEGNGSLTVANSNEAAVFVKFLTLTISNITLEATGKWGIAGKDGIQNETLIIKNATVTAKGSEMAIGDLKTLTLGKCQIVAPEGAEWSDAQHAVVDAGGNKAQEVKIEPVVAYELSIAGTQVTNANCNDLSRIGGVTLALGGEFRYDPATKKLTMKGVTVLAGNKIAILNRDVDGLKIEVLGMNRLESTHWSALTIGAPTEMVGSGLLRVSSQTDAVFVENDHSLSISDVTIEATGVHGLSGSARLMKRLTLKKAKIIAKGSEGGIINLASLITSGCGIVVPEGGTFNEEKHAVVDAGGNVAKEVQIVPIADYGLYIAGTLVTYANSKHLSRIKGVTVAAGGEFKYDPAERTLTMKDVTVSVGDGINAIWNEGIEGLKIVVSGTNSLKTTGRATLNCHNSTEIKGNGSLTVASSSNAAIFVKGTTLTISNITLEATGYWGWGIAGFDANQNETLIIKNATVTAKGSEAAIAKLKTFTLEGCQIIAPEGGKWNDDQHAVVDAGGNVAKEVKIEPTVGYGLYIAGTQVSELNCRDLSKLAWVKVAPEGKFQYNPGTKTLTMKDVTINYDRDQLIRNENIEGLKIEITGTNRLEASSWRAMNCLAATKLEGDGSLTIVSSYSTAVFVKGTTLTISDITLEATGKWGIVGEKGDKETLIIKNATVTAKGTEGAMYDFKTFTLEGECQIVAPEGAEWNDEKKAVVDAGGNVAKEVKIMPVVKYELYIAGEQVTNVKCNDLSGIKGVTVAVGGELKYDPAKNILTMKGVTVSGGNINAIENKGLKGLEIEVLGINSLKTTTATALSCRASTRLEGNGYLTIVSSDDAAVFVGGTTFIISDLTFEATGKWGVVGEDGDKEKLVIRNAMVTAKGSEAAIAKFKTFILEEGRIIAPEGGKWKADKHAVVDAEENVAEEVKIEPVLTYELTIAGTQLTRHNYSDLSKIKGVTVAAGGEFKYNPSKKTLTMKNVVVEIGGYANAIRSGIEGLKIEISGTNLLKAANSSALACTASVSIEGNGSLTIESLDDAAIYLYNATATMSNITLKATGYWGIAGFDGNKNETLIIKNATVTAKGSEAAIVKLKTFTLEECQIIAPEGGKWNDEKHAVVDAEANVAKEVKVEREASSIAVTGVKVTPTTVDLRKSETQQLTISVEPATATNKNYTCNSNDEGVATVDNTGLVTAVGAGTATITITTEDGGKTVKCTVNVTGGGSTPTFALSTTTLNVPATGGTPSVNVTSDKAWTLDYDSSVTWLKASPKAGTGNGTVTFTVTKNEATTPRTVVMTFKQAETEKELKLTITQEAATPVHVPLQGIAFEEPNVKLKVGTSATLVVKYNPDNATNKKVTWVVTEGAASLSVDENGTITATNVAGTATVTAISEDGGHTAECKVTVTTEDVPVESIVVSPAVLNLTVDVTQQLSVLVKPLTATNKTATWAVTSGADIVSVDGTGLVRALKEGTATVTATVGGKTATCTVNVKAKEASTTPEAVEDAVLASVVVAPNPFSSQLRIENPEGVAARYELVNASGLVVRSGSFSATEVIVDTEALPAGLYFVRIEAQNGAKRVVKVVKY